jgi:hypothetical protein
MCPLWAVAPLYMLKLYSLFINGQNEASLYRHDFLYDNITNDKLQVINDKLSKHANIF